MEWLKKLLEAQEIEGDVIEKVIESAKDSQFIPKERFDQVNEAKKQLEEDIKTRDTQLEELSKKAKGHDDLKGQIEELQELNKTTLSEYQEKLERQTFDYALDNALRDSMVKNTKAVRALLDTSTIKLDGDNLTGLEDQLKAIKESDGYLFQQEQKTLGSTGNFGANNSGPAQESVGAKLAKMKLGE